MDPVDRDPNTQILTEIRDEMRLMRTEVTSRIDGLNDRVDGLNDRVDGLNDRVDGLNDRVDGLNERVDGLNDRVDELSGEIRETRRHQVNVEMRVSTEIAAVSGTLIEIRDYLQGQGDLRKRVERNEKDIEELKKRAF